MTKSTITREQAQKIIVASDEVITALAGTNEDVHPDDSKKMCELWDDLNDRYAPPVVVRELARMALAAMDSEPVAEVLSNRPGNDASTIDRALPVGTQLYRHAQPAPVVPDENTLRIQGIEALEEFLTVTTPEPEMVGGIKLAMTCCRALKAIIKNNGWADFNGGNPEKVKAETIISALREPHSDACRAAMLQELQKSAGVSNNCRSNEKVQDLQVGKSQVAPSPFGYVLCNHGRPDPDFVFADWDSAEGTAEHLNGDTDTHDLWTVEPVCLAAAPQEVSHG